MKNKGKNAYFRTIGGKLILISSLVLLFSLTALTAVVLVRMSSAIHLEATAKLESIHSEKKKHLLDVINRARKDSEVIASTMDVRLAVKDLILYHREMNIQADEFYDITGRGDHLTKDYEDIYQEIRANLQKYNSIYGYYDVFIVCAKHGHIMYSNARESDLGENLSTGEFRDSNIARLWKKVITEKKPALVDLETYEPSGGRPAMFVGSPVMEEESVEAVIILQLDHNDISAMLTNSAGMGETGEVYCIGEDLLMRTESRFIDEEETAILTQKVDTPASRVLMQPDDRIFTGTFPDYNGLLVLSVYSHLTLDESINADFDWAIVAEISEEEITAPVRALVLLVIIIAGVILVIAIFVITLFSRTISIPIKLAVEIAVEISKGNLDQTVEEKYTSRKDEIGRLAGSFQFMITQLTEIVGAVRSGTEQIAAASEQLATGNQDLSNRTEQQASALEETSSAIEEMNSSVKSNADNTETTDHLSRAAVAKSEDGSGAVNRVVEAMNEISASSGEIGDIIAVITNIAFQTNLLALNASIEAARAGEHGKGFAVVAVEVRKLAKRSDKAAEEITAIIKNSNKKVEEGVDIANSAGQVLEEINAAVKKVTALVSEISAASQEQLSSVDQIDKTLVSLDENTQKNAALVEEAASSTEELSAQAQELNTTMQFFKLNTATGRAFRGALGSIEKTPESPEELIEGKFSYLLEDGEFDEL